MVFLHTWTERDHTRKVWYRSPSWSPPPNHRSFNVSDILRRADTNGLLDVIVETSIEPHPGLEASAMLLNVSRRDRQQCDAKRGYTCVSDTAQQFDELARTHRMAMRYLDRTTWWPQLAATRRAALPIVRTRPDVTLRTDAESDGTVVSYASIDPVAELQARMELKLAERGKAGFFGYRGPWWGGWGDIVYAARLDTLEMIVSNLPRLTSILARAPPPVYTLPPFNERVSHGLLTSWREGRYTAEMVLMHYLRGLDIEPHFWRFCHVGRHRLSPNGDGVAKVLRHMCH